MIVMRKLRALIKKINRSNPLRLHVLNIKSEKALLSILIMILKFVGIQRTLCLIDR